LLGEELQIGFGQAALLIGVEAFRSLWNVSLIHFGLGSSWWRLAWMCVYRPDLRPVVFPHREGDAGYELARQYA